MQNLGPGTGNSTLTMHPDKATCYAPDLQQILVLSYANKDV